MERFGKQIRKHEVIKFKIIIINNEFFYLEWVRMN
jgi:hypothetical protein